MGCALGPPTHGAGYYEYAVVTDDRGLSLYVLARDVETFFAEHDAEVAALLADLGYTGLVWGAAKNKQDGCPADIYAPRWDPSVPQGFDAPFRAVLRGGAREPRARGSRRRGRGLRGT